jgi:hypothetical protein
MTGAPFAPGSRVGDYEVIRELSRGAVGETFAARAVGGPLEGQIVCLKVLAREFRGVRSAEREAAIKHLRHEARVVSQLDHPNIARLLDSGVAGDVWYLAFELVEGADLSAFGRDALEPDHVAHLALELSKALACAHQRDVLHRDIKPSNILISTTGEVKLVDFGLAKLNAGAASQFSQHVGTPRYFSPEQLRGEALTAATDIYSVGLVLFELLAGSHPFYNPDVDVFRRNVLQGLLQTSLQDEGLPQDLVAIVERCIELDSSKRFANGSALHHALSAALDHGARAGDDTLSEIGVLKVAAGGSAGQSPTRLGRIAERVADIRDEPGDLPTRVTADPTAVFRNVTRVVAPAEAALEQQTDHVVGDLSRIARAVAEQRSSGLEPAVQPHRSGVRPVDEDSPRPQRRQARTTDDGDKPSDTFESSDEQRPAPPAQREAEQTPSSRWWTRGSAIAALCLLCATLGAAVVLLRPRPQSVVPAAEATTSPGPAPAPERPIEAEATLRQEETPAPPANANVSAAGAATPPNPSATPPSNAQEKAERTRRSRAEAGELVSVTIGTIPYGEVIVDGKRVGPAPVVVKLAPGPHRIVGRSQTLRRAETIVVSPEMNHVVLDLRNDQASP